MEEHKAMVPARKSKCAVPLMKSKVEATATEVPIYGSGGNGTVVVTLVVQWRLARFGIADSSLFDDNWCCIDATNSTMAEVILLAPSLHALPETASMSSAKCFTECLLSGTRKEPLCREPHSANYDT
jgi:hypothetical protein